MPHFPHIAFQRGLCVLALFGPWLGTMTNSHGDDALPPKRILLIAGPPDGHPPQTHEYVAGLKIVHALLADQPGIILRTVVADDEWKDGPELLNGTDAVVLFRGEGAKWCSADANRLAAFRRLAERKGGFTVLHWAMGTKSAEPIAAFTALFGHCHGGPDRQYRVLETKLMPVAKDHPILKDIGPITVRDEFYYALKPPMAKVAPQPLLQIEIDGQPQTVAWAWERPEGGRSFGFSGLHFHENWQRPEYRRLVQQGVLWTLPAP